MTRKRLGSIMTTFFSLVNFVAGTLALLVGFCNLLFLGSNPAGAIAGLLALGVGAICLWLASASILSTQQPG